MVQKGGFRVGEVGFMVGLGLVEWGRFRVDHKSRKPQQVELNGFRVVFGFL